MISTDELASEIETDKESLLKFFLLFSKIEYLAKKYNCFNRKLHYPKTDLAAFAKKTKIDFLQKELMEAVRYLNENAPHKETVQNGKIEWEETNPKDICAILNTVRNNLFHGGKYSSGPRSNKGLVHHSIIILEYWLQKLGNK